MEQTSLLVVLGVMVLVVAALGWLLGGLSGPNAREKVEERPEVEDSNSGRPKILVCFGSQTGTAEQFSKMLSEEGRKEGYAMKIMDLEDFDASELSAAETVIFAMATYGEGEPTDNAHGFLRWAKDQVSEELRPLEKARYTVFGLGNTQYEHYNAMGKLTDKLLNQLGGERFYDLGLGDDDRDLDHDFDQWKRGLWAKLRDCIGGEVGPPAASDGETNGETMTIAVEGTHGFTTAAKGDEIAASSTKFYFTASRLRVSESRELRDPADGGSTRHIELECPTKRDAFYETADNLAILAENDADDVRAVLGALGLQKTQRFVFTMGKKHPFPTPCTFGVALARYCDLSAKPKRPALRVFASLIASPDLQAIVDDDDAFHREAIDPSFASLAAVARRFGKKKSTNGHHANGTSSSSSSSFGVFLDKVSTHLQPRYYTLASSSFADKAKAHVVCSVIDLPDGRPGLCSGYLAGLRLGDVCSGFIRPSSFRLPPSATPVPLVLVGPGTGLAPMRAVLRERASGKGPFATGVSEACLYFGCKKPDLDFIYEDELRSYHGLKVLDKMEIAFSRTQAQKIYVQDLMRRPADRVYLKRCLLDANGVLFVCGGTAMGRAVQDALNDVFTDHLDPDLASAAIDNMRQSGRYVQELWA